MAAADEGTEIERTIGEKSTRHPPIVRPKMDGRPRPTFSANGGSASGKSAMISVLGAFAITFVLIYSLSRASWTDFGDEPVVGASATRSTFDDTCLNSLSEGHWELSIDGCPKTTPGVLQHCDNSTGFPRRWASGAPADCLASSLVQADVAAALRGKKVAFVGDSHLRKLYNFLAEFLADERITDAPASDKKEHIDFAKTVKLTDTRLEFYWRAELRSTAAAMNEFVDRDSGTDGGDGDGDAPDLVVCDASAHQAKWARDYGAFMDEMPSLIESVTRFHEKYPSSPIVWMISPPFKEAYDPANPETEFFYSLRKFNDALRNAGLFMPNGPVVPIDMYRIAEGCMDWCYRDNTHVLPSVNVLLFQMIFGGYQRYLEGSG